MSEAITKALTICQPYAELIVSGRKLVENRKWSTNYRGPLIIHAGKSRAWLDNWTAVGDLVFGSIVGVAEVVACLWVEDIRAGLCEKKFESLADHEHTEGPWCWVLENARRIDPVIPYRGRQGLFNIPEEILAGNSL